MNPNTITLIEPDTSSKTASLRNLKCCNCAMTYSNEDYLTLKDAQKLSYFDFAFKDAEKTASVSPICHFCLKEVVLKHNKGPEVRVVINAKGGKTFNCVFYESDKG